MSLADSDIETAIAAQRATQGAQRTAAMPFILIAVLIDMISIGLMVPVLPHIVGQFTRSNDEQTLAFLAVTLTFGIANFVGSPILGALSDRFGRRPVLLLGFAGLALSFFVTAAATALWMLVAVRLFSGAMQSNISIANAYVADISAPEDRARRFGLIGAMFGVGFILGPVIGGVLGDIDVRLPFVVAGSMALINWCYGFFVLPESLPRERRRPFEWKRANPVAALKGLAALKGVGALVWVIGLASLAQFMLHMSWVLYTKFKLGAGRGGLVAVCGGLGLGVQSRCAAQAAAGALLVETVGACGPAGGFGFLPRFRFGHTGLDDVCGDRAGIGRRHRAGGHAKHRLQCGRPLAPGPDHGRGVVAEQLDGGVRAGGGARTAALGVAPAARRLADRLAVFHLLGFAAQRSCRRMALLPRPQRAARSARMNRNTACRTTRS
jgi:MFS family permease